MAKPESLEIVNSYVKKGRDGKWLWGTMAKELFEVEGIDVGDRMAQVVACVSKVLRGCYSTREKAWTTAWGSDGSDRKIELAHCVDILLFEARWTLKNRPAPPPTPKKEKAEKAPKEAPPKEEPAVDAGAAPPPPPTPPKA